MKVGWGKNTWLEIMRLEEKFEGKTIVNAILTEGR